MQNVNLKIEGGFFKLSSDKVAILLQLPSRKNRKLLKHGYFVRRSFYKASCHIIIYFIEKVKPVDNST